MSWVHLNHKYADVSNRKLNSTTRVINVSSTYNRIEVDIDYITMYPPRILVE